MRFNLFIFGIIFALVLSGCVAPSSTTNTQTPTPSPSMDDNHPSMEEPGSGFGQVDCSTADLEANEECFEHLLENCTPSTGIFWKTSDDFPLSFESMGLIANGSCEVRVSVPSSSSSSFAGQSAVCELEKRPSRNDASVMVFDVYDIGTNTCTGTYVDAIQKGTTSTTNPTPEPTPTPSTTKEFSIQVNEQGIVGATKSFTVKKGDTVKLTIMVATDDVSFGGEWTRAPAGSKRSNNDYIFSTGDMAPGSTKTVEFVANESFEFGIYWPGSNVQKGKGSFTVEP